MSNAKHDQNRVPTIQGVSSVDLLTPTDIFVNPATGAVLIDSSSLGNIGITPATKTIATVSSGQKADYYTDGTDDDVQINSAIIAVNSGGGGVVYLKAGTYIISSSINMKSNVILQGDGSTATVVRLANSSSIHMFVLSSVQSMIMRGFEIDGNKANNITGHHQVRGDTNCQNLLFEDLYMHDSPQHGIIFEFISGPHTNISFNRLRVENQGLGSSGSGFYLLYCVNVKMSNITVSGCILDGIQWGDIPGPADKLELNNITTFSNSRYGLYVPSGTCQVNNLISYSNQIGVFLQQNSKINLSNSQIYSNGSDGIRIDSCDSSHFSNVKSYNNGTGSTAAGIRLFADITDVTNTTCNRHTIVGCEFFDNQVSPTQAYGIWGVGSGTVDYNVVTNNNLWGNSNTQFRKDNWGVNNEIGHNVGD